MKKNNYLVVWLIFIVAILHFLAVTFHFYWSIKWFDIPVHFLTAVWASIVVMLVISLFFSNKHNIKVSWAFVLVILFTFLIGVVWEIFEFKTGVAIPVKGYVSDTVLDLLVDIIGGIFGFLYFKKDYLQL